MTQIFLEVIAFRIVRVARGFREAEVLLRSIENVFRYPALGEREGRLQPALRVDRLVDFVVVGGIEHIVRYFGGLLECTLQPFRPLGVVELDLVFQRVRTEMNRLGPVGDALDLLCRERRIDFRAGSGNALPDDGQRRASESE